MSSSHVVSATALGHQIGLLTPQFLGIADPVFPRMDWYLVFGMPRNFPFGNVRFQNAGEQRSP
jgi:hypothetical protein